MFLIKAWENHTASQYAGQPFLSLAGRKDHGSRERIPTPHQQRVVSAWQPRCLTCSLPSILVDSPSLGIEGKGHLVVELGRQIWVVGVAGIVRLPEWDKKEKCLFFSNCATWWPWATYFKKTCPRRMKVAGTEPLMVPKVPWTFQNSDWKAERPEKADGL